MVEEEKAKEKRAEEEYKNCLNTEWRFIAGKKCLTQGVVPS